jgi:taurine dioxygenase
MTVASEKQTLVTFAPITPRFGAVVEGVDGSQSLSEDVVDNLKDAILKFKVLFFRDQNLTSKEQSDFAAHFGVPGQQDGTKFAKDYEEDGLSKVTLVPHFHADHMYGEEGPAFSMLQMMEIPDVGGDTMFADLVASYESLSQPVRDLLETLSASHVMPNYFLSDVDLAAAHKRQYQEDLTPEQVRDLRHMLRPNVHPLVRVIPETGAKNCWVSEQHTDHIVGLSRHESEAILGLLFREQLLPQFVIRWSWSVGDIAFWDHRTTLHSGVADFGVQKRRGQRASVAPNSPVSS